MLIRIVRGLAFWLLVFELLAGARRWWGLSWLGRAAPRAPLLALLPLVLPSRGRWPGRAGVLALAAPLALALQIGASSLRNRALNPLLRLRPGDYQRYTIARHDIPLAPGHLPALLVAPAGGADRAVCVLHGSGCDKTYYAWRLVDTLLGAGRAVLLVDLDGHGENPRPQSFPDILDDVRVAVAWLRERYQQVGLLGVSLGGCLAARAVADGVAVDRLAVLEAPPLLRFNRADVWREGGALARPFLLDLFGDCSAYNLARAWEVAPIRATISTWDLIERLDLLGSLRRLPVPALLLYGADDAIVKPAQAEQARQHMPAGSRFRLVPRASHLTLVLTPPALEEIAAWFG